MVKNNVQINFKHKRPGLARTFMFFMRSSGSDASIRLAHVRSWVKGFAQVSGLAIKGSIIVSQSSQIPGALRVP
jgi:hypothetical protein